MLFVGNGFDQALGHKTSYSEFYESKFFKALLIKGNALCIQIYDQIKNKSDEKRWSDLENGLYDYSQSLTQTFGEGNVNIANWFEEEFDELKQSLFDYLRYIQEEDVPYGGRPKLLLKWKELSPIIVTFNYTINLLAELQDKAYINDKNKIIPLHGTIKDIPNGQTYTKDDIVLGIDESQIVEELHSFLYKSRQRKFDVRQLQQLINNQSNYIVFGCSMGMSDATYFKMLFDEQQSGKRYLIYGKDAESVGNIQKNLFNYVGNWIDFSKRNEVFFLKTEECEDCLKQTEGFVNKVISDK